MENAILETPSPYAAKVLDYQVKGFAFNEGAWDKGKPFPPSSTALRSH